MYNYNTVMEAVEGLEGRGYTKDFNVSIMLIEMI